MTSGRKVLYVERLRPPLWPLFTDWKTPVFSYPRLIRRGLRKFSGRTGFIFVYPGRVRSALSLELGRTQIDYYRAGSRNRPVFVELRSKSSITISVSFEDGRGREHHVFGPAVEGAISVVSYREDGLWQELSGPQ